MKRNYVILLNVAIILMSLCSVNLQTAYAQGIITIRADGSIDPASAPISTSDNMHYVLTGDVEVGWGIVVERDSITLDGNGYTLSGIGEGYGIVLEGRQYVEVFNLTIQGFQKGMSITGSEYCRIIKNTIKENQDDGIDLDEYSYENTIFGNIIKENQDDGIDCDDDANYNLIYGNDILFNGDSGITFWKCDHNQIYLNNFVGNTNHVDSTDSINVWNTSYAEGGGNYWSDYAGNDLYSGPNQDQPGPDGILDSSRVIDADNVDSYPLSTTIDIVQKIPTTIHLFISIDPSSPNPISAGERVYVDGNIYPRRSGVTVTIHYIQPDTTILDRTLTTGPFGYYDEYFTIPPVFGLWSVTASWAGDSTHMGATSRTYTFTVSAETKTPTTITVQTDKTEYCENDEVVITGVIDPPLSGVTVTFDAGSLASDLTTTTDANGAYRLTKQFSSGGTNALTWTIVASYLGNLTHSGSTSDPVSFQVNLANSLGICCFIATATYGSVLAPEVQFLRNFRANTVLTTFAGQQFMVVFNGIYYSFSPTVASGIAGNEGLRMVMRGVLYPLLQILQFGEGITLLFGFSPNFGIIAFCLVVSALLSLVYLVPWALLLSYWKRHVVSAKIVRLGSYLLAGSLVMLLVAVAVQSPFLTMVGGAMTVFVITGLTTLVTTRTIMKHLITS